MSNVDAPPPGGADGDGLPQRDVCLVVSCSRVLCAFHLSCCGAPRLGTVAGVGGWVIRIRIRDFLLILRE